MARINIVKRSLKGGEVSRDVQGLQNAAFYSNSVERMENFIPHPQGKSTFRPPTKHLGKAFGLPTKSLAFNASEGDGYVLVLESGGFVAYTKDGRVEFGIGNEQSVVNDSEYLGSNTFKFAMTGVAPLQDGQIVSADIVVTDSVHATVFNMSVQGRVFAYSAVGFETTFSVQFDENPLTSLNNNSLFTFSNFFQLGGAAAQGVDFDADLQSVQIANEMHVVIKGMANLYRINYDPNVAENLRFSGFFYAIAGQSNFSAIGFYEQRLILGKDNILFFSEVNNFGNFTIGTNADDPLQYTIAGANNNASDILWIKANERFLLVGTQSGNYVVRGAGEFDPISPNAITIKPIDSLGSSSAEAVNSDSRVYFVERGKETLRALEFNFAIRGFNSLDLSLLTKHIGEEKIKRIVFFQDDPNRILAVLESGQMAMVVIDRQAQQSSWTRIKHADGKIIDANVAFDGEGKDTVFLIVERVVNGFTNNYVEVLKEEVFYSAEIDFYTGDEVADKAAYSNYLSELQPEDVRLDSQVRFSPTISSSTSLVLGVDDFFVGVVGSTEQDLVAGEQIRETGGPGIATVIDVVGTTVNVTINTAFSTTNFSIGELHLARPVFPVEHLSGKDVKVVVEGLVYERTVAVDGNLDLSDIVIDEPTESVMFVGLQYRGLIKTLPLRGFSQIGETDFQKKDISSFFLKVDNSLGIKYGTDPYDLQNLELDEEYDALFPSGKFFSGVTEDLYIESDTAREAHLYIVQDSPFPVNIISFGFHVRSEST